VEVQDSDGQEQRSGRDRDRQQGESDFLDVAELFARLIGPFVVRNFAPR
jgi:hypothetical protein